MTVIAIVLILTGVLLPVLATAKESAKRTSCASNLRQLNASIVLYSGDFDDRFARGKDCGDLADPQLFPPSSQIAEVPMLQAVLAPYTHSPALFKCPDDDGMAVLEAEFPLVDAMSPSDYASCGSSYEYRTELGLSTSSIASFSDPTKVNLLADLAGHWHGTSAAALPTENLDQFQEKAYFYRYELLFLDGHVNLVSHDQLEAAWKSY